MEPLLSLRRISNRTLTAARIVVTSVFWAPALVALAESYRGLFETGSFGADPRGLYQATMIAVQLFGAALIIANRGAWPGVSALAAYTIVAMSVARSGGAYDEGSLPYFGAAILHVGALACLTGLALLQSVREQAAAASRPDQPEDPGYRISNWRYI